jgi:hypothetical protein
VPDVAAAIAAQQAVPLPPAGGLITNFTNVPKSRLDMDGIQYGIHAANITLEDTPLAAFARLAASFGRGQRQQSLASRATLCPVERDESFIVAQAQPG